MKIVQKLYKNVILMLEGRIMSEKVKSSTFSGIFYTIAVVAPALGYVLSGLFLRIPIDFK